MLQEINCSLISSKQINNVVFPSNFITDVVYLNVKRRKTDLWWFFSNRVIELYHRFSIKMFYGMKC